MQKRSLISPEGQGVTFVELFFDLVYVFAITQITALLHGNLDFEHISQALVIFWLIWWSWTQFSWTLNGLDTTNTFVEFATLLATAVAFFMAISIPVAFETRGLMFALTYIFTRGIGLAFQVAVPEAIASKEQIFRWIGISVLGLISVLVGGIVGGSLQIWFWLGAIVFDFIAATTAGSGEWLLQSGHFAERHGLIIIIALGESLIVAASGLISKDLDTDLLFIGIYAVVITCALWWSYFVKVKPALEHKMEETTGIKKANYARDIYSFSHFPLLIGIIALALVVEETIAHPHDLLPSEDRGAFAVGLSFFLLGTVFAVWRATGRLMVVRLLITSITAILLVWGLLGVSELLIGSVALVVILIVEHFQT